MRDLGDDEAGARNRPCGSTTEIGPINRKALHGGSDQRRLSSSDVAERTRQRAIGRVNSRDASGICLRGEHVDPPGFADSAETFQADVWIRAASVGTDLRGLILNRAIGGVNASPERIPVDVHEAWRGLLTKQDRWQNRDERDGSADHNRKSQCWLTPQFSCTHTTTIAAKLHPKRAHLLHRWLGGALTWA